MRSRAPEDQEPVSEPPALKVLRGARISALAARFCIVGLPADADPTPVLLGSWSAALRTGDEVTLYLPEEDWDAAAARFPRAHAQRGWRLLRVEARIPWDTHGVLAHLTGALAARGIPCAALCAFSTDHILVPEPRLEEARDALRALFASDSAR